MYFDDIDTPIFDHLNRQAVTKHFVLEPLKTAHFLDMFEFRLQNEYNLNEDIDPFDNMGERLEKAYTQFFTYICNVDNLAWVLLDRTFVCGFFMLTVDVDYNEYMDRSASLYYELGTLNDKPEYHAECIKAIADLLFSDSDIPRLEMYLDEKSGEDSNCIEAAKRLGFIRGKCDCDNNRCYFLMNNDPTLLMPPRHLPYILKAYQDFHKTKNKKNGPN